MDPQQSMGFAHFLTQTDVLGKTILGLLIVMSITTWYLIITKTWSSLAVRMRTREFLRTFWNAPSLDMMAARFEKRHPNESFSHLAWQAMVASRHHQRHGTNNLNESVSAGDFLTRAMRRVIDEETARMESGLIVLASIGSTAPFIGLLGTVWGVYHALVAIGMSGQGTLDKVAGPVGEALIMTGLGLAVAIPAVLAYNFCVRSNRMVLGQLDSFAHDLFALLTTGSHFSASAGVTPIHGSPAVRGAV